jgi:hypothetical protein
MVSSEGFGGTRGDVYARLQSDFSKEDRELARHLLSRCDELPESPRVRLAVLELSGGSLDLLKHYVQQAEADYRDVLYWAFYGPHQSSEPDQRGQARRL